MAIAVADPVKNYRLAGASPAVNIPHDAWYQCPVPREVLKALMRRSDWPALGNYALWLGSGRGRNGLRPFLGQPLAGSSALRHLWRPLRVRRGIALA